MFLLPLNVVASTEQECRDPHLPAVPHTEDAEENGRRVFFLGQKIQRVQHTSNLPVPQNLKTMLLKQQTQAVNDRIPAKGCRHLLVKPWVNGKGNGKRVSCVEPSSATVARSLEPADLICFLEHVRKAHRACHEHRVLEHWFATCYSPAGSVGRNLEERVQKQLVAIIRKAPHPCRRSAAKLVLRHICRKVESDGTRLEVTHWRQSGGMVRQSVQVRIVRKTAGRQHKTAPKHRRGRMTAMP